MQWRNYNFFIPLLSIKTSLPFYETANKYRWIEKKFASPKNFTFEKRSPLLYAPLLMLTEVSIL